MSLSEADERYLGEVAADAGSWLGPGATLIELRSERTETGFRLLARYMLEGHERHSEAVGETLHSAHVALRARVLFDRLGIGLETIVAHR